MLRDLFAAAVLTCLLSGAIPANAADTEAKSVPMSVSGGSGWMPSLASTFGIYFVDYTAEVESSVRGSDSGSEFVITPFVDFVFELMSPPLESIFDSRFFVQGSVGPSFGQDVVVASEGALGPLEFPDLPLYGQGAIQGLGSETVIEAKSPVYGARLGGAFRVPGLERTIRVKPSLGWSSQTYRARGEVLQVFRQGFTGPNTIVRLKGADTRTSHSIGAGIEVEVDFDSVGSIGISGYVYSYGHYLLNDRKRGFTTQDESGRSASWRYETDSPWLYRSGFGVRLKWLGV